jgi:choline kinase
MTAAIVLAAGRGSRLDKYTRHLPKALVRAGGRSLLEWHRRALRDCGVSTVVVAGGYRFDRLAPHAAELIEVPGWHEAGPLASLVATRPERLAGDFLVVYADCPHHPLNLRRVLDSPADIAVAGDREWKALWTQRCEDPLLDAETYRGSDGVLQAIGARPCDIETIEAQFAGLLHFTARGWQRTRQILDATAPQPSDMTGLLALLLRAGERIADVAIHGRWCEIDSARDLQLCRRRLRDHSPWSHDWRATRNEPRCR